ncbi:hypothetical protein [Myroides odoratus]|uniref:hypothetical protein n=1 Tax=Myroides odoratus TaxID=256 RepID=UPI0039B00AE5
MSNMLKILLSISLLGFFLIPGEALACSSHTTEVIKKDKSCYDDSHHSNHLSTCEKDCCKDKTGADTDCSGNCCQNYCQSSSPTYLIHDIKDSQEIFLFGDKKSFPLYKQPYYSSGFHSIWQPPKIG